MHHDAHFAGIDHASVGKGTRALGTHDQGIVAHADGAAGEGVQTVADGIGAVAAFLGFNEAVIQSQTGVFLGGVGGEGAPVFTPDVAVVIGDVGIVHQVGGADSAGQAQHPRHFGHAGDVVGLGAIPGEQLGVVHHHLGVFAAHHSGADGADGVDFGAVDSDLGVASSGDADALAGEVAAAVADQIHLNIFDNGFAASDVDPAKVIAAGDNLQIFHRGIGDLCLRVDSRGNGFAGHVFAIFQYDGICHAVVIHATVVFIVHQHAVDDRQLHIAGVNAGVQILLHTVYRKDHTLVFRRGNGASVPDGQRGEGNRFTDHPVFPGGQNFFIRHWN